MIKHAKLLPVLLLLVVLSISLSSAYVPSSRVLFGLNFTLQANDTTGNNDASGVGGANYVSNAECPNSLRYPCYNQSASGQELQVANTSIHRAGDSNLSSGIISWWMMERDNSTSRNDRVFWMNNTINDVQGLMITSGISTGRLSAQFIPNTGATSAHLNQTPTAGVAYHYAVAWNGSQACWFRDGVKSNCTSYTGGLPRANQAVRLFGASNIGGSSGSVNGTVDDFYVLDMEDDSWSYVEDTVQALFIDGQQGFGPGEGDPTEIYVSKVNGDDGYPGNSTHPIKTITKLREILDRGDRVWFDGGLDTQNFNNVWRMPEDFYLNTTFFPSGGSSVSWINLTCYNCNETYLPTFTATSLLVNANWTATGTANVWRMTNNPGFGVANFLIGNISADFDLDAGYRYNTTVTVSGLATRARQGGWIQNRTTAGVGDYQVYMYSVGNPATVYSDGLELVWADMSTSQTRGVCFQIFNRNYLSFTMMKVIGCDHGFINEGSYHIIHNITMGYIGGGYCISGCSGFTRWGNGIDPWKGAQNHSIKYNKVYEVYDAPYSPQATSAATYTAANHIWSYNIGWNSSTGYEHYYDPTTARSINISFVHNTLVEMGNGWWREQRQLETSQTVKPRGARMGRSLNVVGHNFSDNLVYNASQYMVGFQSTSSSTNPGWNTSVNYTFDHNYYYKDNDPLYNITAWFGVPGVGSGTFGSLSEWQNKTVHDDHSITDLGVWPFTDYSLRFIPRSDWAGCGAGTMGDDIGAVACADISSLIVLPWAADSYVSPPNNLSTANNSGCDLGYDGNPDTGVSADFCTEVYSNWTNPGQLFSGGSKLFWREQYDPYSTRIPEFLEQQHSLPAACEITPNIMIRQTYNYEEGVVTDWRQVNLSCYDGANWVEITNDGGFVSQATVLYELGLNLSRLDYAAFYPDNTTIGGKRVNPSNASLLDNYLSFNMSLTSDYMGGSLEYHIYVYNTTGVYYDFDSTANFSASVLLPNSGTFYINGSVSNGTHVAYTDNRTIISFIALNITNPSVDGNSYENTLNLTWDSNGFDPSLFANGPVTYRIERYNSSGGLNATLHTGTNATSLVINFADYNLTNQNVTLRVTLNDTTTGLLTYDEVSFSTTAISRYNITAKKLSNNESITNFTVTFDNAGSVTTYTTTNGSVVFIGSPGVTYNITVNSSGYFSNSTLFGTNASSSNLTFTLRGQAALNITFYNEDTQAQLAIPVSLDFISDSIARNYTAPVGNITIFNLEPGTYTLRYVATGYTTRFYTLTITDTSDSTTHLALYLVNQSLAYNVTVRVIDQLTNPVEGAVVKALKYYLNLNDYVVQEIGVTNNNGQVLMTLTYNDEYYKFMVEVDGEVLKVTEPEYITSSSKTIVIQTDESYMEIYNKYAGISSNLVFNTATDSFRADYSYASNLAYGTLLVVYQVANISFTEVGRQSSTSATATLLQNVTPVNGTTYIAYLYYLDEDNNYRYLDSELYTYPGGPSSGMGATGVYAQILLTMGVSSIAFINPPAAMILAPVSLILGKAVGLHELSYTALFGLLAVGMLFAGILMKK